MSPLTPLKPSARATVYALLALIVGLGLVSTLLLLNLNAGVAAQQRSDEIAGCRGTYRVQLIDAPTFSALKATAEGDDRARDAAIRRGDPERYEELIRLSTVDPDRFLAMCRSLRP